MTSPSRNTRKTSDRISKLVSKFESNDIPLVTPRASSASSTSKVIPEPNIPTHKEARKVNVKKLAIGRVAPAPPSLAEEPLVEAPLAIISRHVVNQPVVNAEEALQPMVLIAEEQAVQANASYVEQKQENPQQQVEKAQEQAQDEQRTMEPKIRLKGLSRPPARPSSSTRTVSFASDNSTLVGDRASSQKKSPASSSFQSSSRQTSLDLPSTSSKRPPLPPSRSSGALSSQTTDIPAADIFARSARPLELPALDQYLDSIPPFEFTETATVVSDEEKKDWEKWLEEPAESSWAFWKKKRKATHAQKQASKLLNTRSAIFPPMHLIPPSLTVADLQQNKTAAPPFLALDATLGTIIDGVLGAQGSTYAIGLMNVELFRDSAQMLSLALTYFTRSPISPGSKASSVFSIFSTITSALGFDFVSAFGKSIVWFWMFLALGAYTVYEFYQMSGGWRGKIESEDLGEGFDREDAMNRDGKKGRNGTWRDSRAYKICIVFIATSLVSLLRKLLSVTHRICSMFL